MDKNIYEKVCQLSGHKISLFTEKVQNPKDNTILEVTTRICTQCGGEGEDLAEAPRGFKPKKEKGEK